MTEEQIKKCDPKCKLPLNAEEISPLKVLQGFFKFFTILLILVDLHPDEILLFPRCQERLLK